MWSEPRPRDSFFWGAVGFGLLGLLVWLGDQTETQRAASVQLILMAGCGFLGTWAVVMGVGNFIAWAAMVHAEVAHQRRETEVLTPVNQALMLASRLTSEQVSIMPDLRFRHEVETVMGMEGATAHFLRTPGGSIPFVWVEEFLRDCGVTWLKPVRNYADGTPGREYATALTEWLIQQGYAVPAAGNRAAMWMTEHAREQVKRILGFENVD